MVMEGDWNWIKCENIRYKIRRLLFNIVLNLSKIYSTQLSIRKVIVLAAMQFLLYDVP